MVTINDQPVDGDDEDDDQKTRRERTRRLKRVNASSQVKFYNCVLIGERAEVANQKE